MGDMISVSEGKIALYAIEGANIYVDVVFKDETFWMTQKAIADLFDAERSVITKHISNICGEEELFRAATSARIALVQKRGQPRRQPYTRVLQPRYDYCCRIPRKF